MRTFLNPLIEQMDDVGELVPRPLSPEQPTTQPLEQSMTALVLKASLPKQGREADRPIFEPKLRSPLRREAGPE